MGFHPTILAQISAGHSPAYNWNNEAENTTTKSNLSDKNILRWQIAVGLVSSLTLLVFQWLALGSAMDGLQSELLGFCSGLLSGYVGAQMQTKEEFDFERSMMWPNRALAWAIIVIPAILSVCAIVYMILTGTSQKTVWIFVVVPLMSGMPVFRYFLLHGRSAEQRDISKPL